LLQKGVALLGPLSSVPWLARLAFNFPVIPWVRDWNSMMKWAHDCMQERMGTQVDRRDVSSWLLDASSKEKDNWLDADAITLLVAGSQTVSSTLVYIFYYLASFPQEKEKLYQELLDSGSKFNSNNSQDWKTLQDLPHLNAVINETLRLQPAVPTGGLRLTPLEGVTVDGQHIPGGVTIAYSRYSLGRLSSCYEQAQDFIPERWYSKPEMVKDKRAFIPFSIGRYNCVGKNLALMELRAVTARLVRNFDIEFAAEDMGRSVCVDMKDHFTITPGKLALVYTPRESINLEKVG